MVYKITIRRVSMRMLIPVAVAFFVVAGTAPAFAEVVIEPLPGSATAGCEQTELGCYNYPVLRVNPGTEITFLNTDNAAHTLTSGSSADGPTGVFDSSLIMVGSWYKFTLEEEGTYEHYCLVHPWMTGRIVVGSETTPVEDAPTPAPASPPVPAPASPPSTPSSMEVVIEPLPGSATAGCEQTEEGCYNIPVLTVAPGTTITFSNTDNAAHTLTSGSPADGPTGVFDSGLVMVGGWYKFTLEEEGTYEHYCLVHPWMTGRIIVAGDVVQVPASQPPQQVPERDAGAMTMEDRIKKLEERIRELEGIIKALTERLNGLFPTTAPTTALAPSPPEAPPIQSRPSPIVPHSAHYIKITDEPGTIYGLGDLVRFEASMFPCEETVYGLDGVTVTNKAWTTIYLKGEDSMWLVEDSCYDEDVSYRLHGNDGPHMREYEAAGDHSTLSGALAVDRFAPGEYYLQISRSGHFDQKYYTEVFMLG